jgi:hypothetical protein
MKKIRKRVFETNSSSMHSLAIIGSDRMSKCQLSTTIIDGEEKIVVESGEYGWGYDTLTTPIEKLSYIVTMIPYHNSNVSISESRYFKWLSDMVKDYTGYELSYQSSSSNYYEDGYIDHQSTDTLDDVWVNDEEEFKNNMKNIVFNDKYFIIIDNDNH